MNGNALKMVVWGGAVTVTALALSALASGCSAIAFAQCEYELECCLGLARPTTSSSSSSGDGGPPKECIPSLAGVPVDDSCGVFVSSSLGDDANAGTSKSEPVKSLKRALMIGAQNNLPVYACAEVITNADGEALSVSAGSVMFGGLDCAGDWSYAGDAKKTVVQGSADQIAMVLRTGSGTTHLEDFVVRAADAVMAGGSSIAVLAEPSNVELTRCELIAGKGQDGAKGETPTDDIGPSDANDLKIKGGSGAKAGLGDVVNGNPGGTGTVNALCMSAVGGNGGAGFVDHGGDGTDGMPMGALGTHGSGEPVMGSWNCAVAAGFGGAQIGDNGAAGTEGASASEMDLGTLDLNGFIGTPGQSGSDGMPGQGGGGAGAAKGKAGLTGASGGGGGAGGCGGKGGGGGQGGGASIGLASLGATLTFNALSIATGTGGRGGDGGLGQGGATGGAGGTGGAGDLNAPATLNGCNGGQGGYGGKGGDGGAGRGGHAVGLMYLGAAPPLEGATFFIGTAGAGGQAFMSQGAVGIAADTLELP